MSLDIFQEWRGADQSASAAERAVRADSLRAVEAMGSSPAVYHVEKAKRRRAMANELLKIAKVAVAAQALANKHSTWCATSLRGPDSNLGLFKELRAAEPPAHEQELSKAALRRA